MPCAACQARGGKTWNGDDPKCAFEGSIFSEDNWNCAALNALRNWGDPYEPQHPRVQRNRYDDQSYMSVDLAGIDVPSGDANTLWVGWYKNRGRTEAMWLLGPDTQPWRPTEQDCAAITAALTDLQNSTK